MEMYMKTLTHSWPLFSEKTKALSWAASQVFMGSIFLSVCAQLTIPLYPVPMTMQTLGVFILAIMQGGKKASFSTLLYLGFAFLGLPVLANGTAQALWFALPTAGFLVSFPIAAFVIGKLVHAKEKPSALWVLMSVCVGQIIIYSLGVANLTRFLSLQQSLMVGVIPFLFFAGVKVLFSSTLGGVWLRLKKK